MTTLLEWFFRFLAWMLRRPRLNIRVIEDNPDKEVGGLRFEAENTSPSRSSLFPVIEVRFIDPFKSRMRCCVATFDVRELDRELPPFRAKEFSASARKLPPGYSYTWFRVYRFRARLGVPRRVRIRNCLLQPLGPVRFWFELWRFRLFGRLKEYGEMTISDYEALKRSQGPH